MYTRSQDDVLPAARRRHRRDRRRPADARRPGRAAAPAPPPGPVVALAAPVPAPASVGRIPAGRRPALRLLVEVALTLGALLGLVVAGLTVGAVRSGLRPLVVRSGSMEPTIPVGSMVLMRRIPAADIRPGDVVAVERPDRTRVTHRVVQVAHRGEVAELTLKGDANEDVDPRPVTVRSADRLVRHVPRVGRAAAWLATAQGGFAVGSVVTLAAVQALRRRPDPGDG